jgi:hypothetical protein
MIHLALSIAAFLFLAWIGFYVMIFAFAILASIVAPKKPTNAQLIAGCLTANHDSRNCNVCGSRKPHTVQRCPQPCLKHNSCLPERP